MSKSNDFENDLLKLILTGVGISGLADNTATGPLATLYFALHSADPGEAGNQATNEIAYTGYARAAVARTTAGWTITGNVAALAAAINFPQGTGGGGMATFFSLGTAASGTGKILWKGVIGTSVGPFTAATTGVFTIPGSGLVVNDRVAFFTFPGSALPTGITEGVLYYVLTVPNADTVTISATQGGSAIAITASGDGIAYKDVGVMTGANYTPQLGTGTTITED